MSLNAQLQRGQATNFILDAEQQMSSTDMIPLHWEMALLTVTMKHGECAEEISYNGYMDWICTSAGNNLHSSEKICACFSAIASISCMSFVTCSSTLQNKTENLLKIPKWRKRDQDRLSWNHGCELVNCPSNSTNRKTHNKKNQHG